MPYVHNTKAGAQFFQTDNGKENIKLNPGINKISDDQYKTFKEKIDADPKLLVVEEMNDVPAKLEPPELPTDVTSPESVVSESVVSEELNDVHASAAEDSEVESDDDGNDSQTFTKRKGKKK